MSEMGTLITDLMTDCGMNPDYSIFSKHADTGNALCCRIIYTISFLRAARSQNQIIQSNNKQNAF